MTNLLLMWWDRLLFARKGRQRATRGAVVRPSVRKEHGRTDGFSTCFSVRFSAASARMCGRARGPRALAALGAGLRMVWARRRNTGRWTAPLAWPCWFGRHDPQEHLVKSGRMADLDAIAPTLVYMCTRCWREMDRPPL